MEHNKEKCESGAHTRKSAKNEARLVITYRVRFSDAYMAKEPPHLRNGMSLLREILKSEGGEEAWNAAFTADAEEIFEDEDGVDITEVKVEVCS